MKIVYQEIDNWFIGHIQEYPNYETQGETLEELKTNLMDIYQDIMGCEFVRHGGNHDWYKNPKTGEQQPIGRHTQIHDQLAKKIIKRLS